MGFFTYNLDSPIFFEECLSPDQNKIFRNTIDKFHSYVKYKDVPQRRINWNIYDTKSGDVVGAIGISSCVLAINARDSWIGWNKEQRLKQSNSVGNNYRFCIIPNSGIKNLGTISLKMFRTLSVKRWKEKYGDDLVLIETYVQPSITDSDNKRNGAVYLADNWIQVGQTMGNSIKKAPVLLWQKENSKRGELARSNPDEAIKKYAVGREHYVITESEKKLVFVKPLMKNFRKVLLS